MLKIKQCFSTNISGHRVLNKDAKTILRFTEYLQDNRVQKADGSLQQPRSLISQASVQSSLSQVSAMFLLPFPGRTSS
jgi:hypothetical protein